MAEATKKMQLFEKVSKAMDKKMAPSRNKRVSDDINKVMTSSAATTTKSKAGASNPASNTSMDYKKYFK